MEDNKELLEIYEHLYAWHLANLSKFPVGLQFKKEYNRLIHDLPKPANATIADVAFVLNQMDEGLMKWSLTEIDPKGKKLAEYSENGIQMMGGLIRNRSIAEKSKIAWKYLPRMSALRRIIEQLSTQDLRRLFLEYHKGAIISEKPVRDILTDKILHEIPSEFLFNHPTVLSTMITDFALLDSFLKEYILSLDVSEIRDLYSELGMNAPSQEQKNKNKVVDQLLATTSLESVVESKNLRKWAKTKTKAERDLDELKSGFKTLCEHTDKLVRMNLDNKYEMEELKRTLRQLSKADEQMEASFGMKSSPEAMALLQAMRKEMLSEDETPSPEKLIEIMEKTRVSLKTDEFSFLLRGIELMMTHYLLGQMRKMHWKIDPEEFMQVVREEIRKIQILPNQAEIPLLRERITQILGITDEVFDQHLLDAWKNGQVKLEIGAPIGRENVKYLKYGQTAFFYVKVL